MPKQERDVFATLKIPLCLTMRFKVKKNNVKINKKKDILFFQTSSDH